MRQQGQYGFPQAQYPYTAANPGYGYGGGPAYPQVPGYPQVPAGGTQNPAQNVPGMLPLEESYIENILRLNKGKVITAYMRFREEAETQKAFRGVIEAAGRDHLILSDPQTGTRFLLLMIYLDYVTFDEEIDYQYQYPY